MKEIYPSKTLLKLAGGGDASPHPLDPPLLGFPYRLAIFINHITTHHIISVIGVKLGGLVG